MRAIIQRVTQASVSVQGGCVSEIGKGLMVLVGLTASMGYKYLISSMKIPIRIWNTCKANKIITMRLFSNHDSPAADTTTPLKPWSTSVKDCQLDILSVSQFTLFAQTHKGTKPDFHLAMKAPDSQLNYAEFVEMLKNMYNDCHVNKEKAAKWNKQESLVRPHDHIKDGVFGAMMQVQLVNDGPVTIIIDSKDKK